MSCPGKMKNKNDILGAVSIYADLIMRKEQSR